MPPRKTREPGCAMRESLQHSFPPLRGTQKMMCACLTSDGRFECFIALSHHPIRTKFPSDYLAALICVDLSHLPSPCTPLDKAQPSILPLPCTSSMGNCTELRWLAVLPGSTRDTSDACLLDEPVDT